MILAIDGGATATRCQLYGTDGQSLGQEVCGPPCNPVALGLEPALAALEAAARPLLHQNDAPLTLAAGISGAANASLRRPMAQALASRWGLTRAVLTNDLCPILAANVGHGPGLAVIAGTGSSVLAQAADGLPRLFGGRGPLFGDPGSAYGLASAAMKCTAASADGFAPPTALTAPLLKATGCAEVFEMAAWSVHAGRHGVAALAPLVVEAAQEGDPAATACFAQEVEGLARLVQRACAEMGLPSDAPILTHGGLFTQCAPFREGFAAALGQDAAHRLQVPLHTGCSAARYLADEDFPTGYPISVALGSAEDKRLSLTERRLADAPPLDSLDAPGIVALMNREDRMPPQAVAAAAPVLARVVERAAEAIRTGGRILYTGAGTSGRLGVLDASECPPTFGVDPARVVGIMAGGDRALRNSVETAEDSPEQGRAAFEALEPPLHARDIVVGIAASGNTPYVHGALAFALEKGAAAVLLTCNPAAQCPGAEVIALATGPEVLPGSTRLKAGTATKLALNIISTGAMVRAGYVFEGLMVRVGPVNAKLRKRATRITAELTGLEADAADGLLRNAGDDIATAVYMHRRQTTPEAARSALAQHDWNLREALDNSF